MSVPCTRHAIRRIDPERPTPLTWLLNRKENPLQYDPRRISTACFVLPLYVFKSYYLPIIYIYIFYLPLSPLPFLLFFTIFFFSFCPIISLEYGKDRENGLATTIDIASSIPPIPLLIPWSYKWRIILGYLFTYGYNKRIVTIDKNLVFPEEDFMLSFFFFLFPYHALTPHKKKTHTTWPRKISIC